MNGAWGPNGFGTGRLPSESGMYALARRWGASVCMQADRHAGRQANHRPQVTMWLGWARCNSGSEFEPARRSIRTHVLSFSKERKEGNTKTVTEAGTET